MSTSNAEISITQDRAEQESRAAITAAYFGAFIALGLTTGALGPTLPGLAAHAHVRLSVVSYLFTVRSLGHVFGSLRGGRLFDRRAGNPVIAVMLIAMAAIALLVGTFGIGLFMASIFPTVISFAGQHLKLTGQVTGRFIVGASAGAMTLPLLIGQIFEPVGSRAVLYVVLGALLSASAILFLLLRQSVRPAIEDSKRDLANCPK